MDVTENVPLAFGFSGSPEIPLTLQNVGFLDQRLALNWVQRNTAAFGGDSAKIMISATHLVPHLLIYSSFHRRNLSRFEELSRTWDKQASALLVATAT